MIDVQKPRCRTVVKTIHLDGTVSHNVFPLGLSQEALLSLLDLLPESDLERFRVVLSTTRIPYIEVEHYPSSWRCALTYSFVRRFTKRAPHRLLKKELRQSVSHIILGSEGERCLAAE